MKIKDGVLIEVIPKDIKKAVLIIPKSVKIIDLKFSNVKNLQKKTLYSLLKNIILLEMGIILKKQ